MVGFAPFSTISYFTISDYIICKQLSPSNRKTQLFALYSNHCIAAKKTKIRWDINYLNAMQTRFMNQKKLIQFDNFLSYKLKTLMRLLGRI